MDSGDESSSISSGNDERSLSPVNLPKQTAKPLKQPKTEETATLVVRQPQPTLKPTDLITWEIVSKKSLARRNKENKKRPPGEEEWERVDRMAIEALQKMQKQQKSPLVFLPGDFCMVHLQGYPLWPARVTAEDDPDVDDDVVAERPARANVILIRFYGDDNYMWANPTAICHVSMQELAAGTIAHYTPVLRSAYRLALSDMRKSIAVAESTSQVPSKRQTIDAEVEIVNQPKKRRRITETTRTKSPSEEPKSPPPQITAEARRRPGRPPKSALFRESSETSEAKDDPVSPARIALSSPTPQAELPSEPIVQETFRESSPHARDRARQSSVSSSIGSGLKFSQSDSENEVAESVLPRVETRRCNAGGSSTPQCNV